MAKIQVNYTQIEALISKINGQIDQLEAAVSAANSAGAAAVKAGGESTDIGGAIQAAIVAPGLGEIQKAKARAKDFADKLRLVGAAYSKTSEDLVAKIKAMGHNNMTQSN